MPCRNVNVERTPERRDLLDLNTSPPHEFSLDASRHAKSQNSSYIHDKPLLLLKLQHKLERGDNRGNNREGTNNRRITQ